MKQLLQLETPDFITSGLWPPNSPELNPVNNMQWRTEWVGGLECPIDVAKFFVGILITQNASKYSIFNQM